MNKLMKFFRSPKLDSVIFAVVPVYAIGLFFFKNSLPDILFVFPAIIIILICGPQVVIKWLDWWKGRSVKENK